MKLYSVEITSTVYVVAEDAQDAERRALSIERNHWLTPDPQSTQITDAEDVPTEHSNAIVWSTTGMTTIHHALGAKKTEET